MNQISPTSSELPSSTGRVPPVEIWLAIFKCADKFDVSRIRQVCREWYQLSMQLPSISEYRKYETGLYALAIELGRRDVLEALPDRVSWGILLDIAAETGSVEMIKYCILRGIKSKWHLLDTSLMSGLYHASVNGHIEATKYCLLHTLSPHNWAYSAVIQKGLKDIEKCYKDMARINCIKSIQLLRQEVRKYPKYPKPIPGASYFIPQLIDGEWVDVKGVTILHLASYYNRPARIRQLLDSGAFPNASDIYSTTPLQIAAAVGHFECVKVLIEYPNRYGQTAEQDWTNSDGKTALDFAIEFEHLRVVKYLSPDPLV